MIGGIWTDESSRRGVRDEAVWAFAPEVNRSNYLWNPSWRQHIGEVSNSKPVVDRHRFKNWGFEAAVARGWED
jgi:hypothetical protein